MADTILLRPNMVYDIRYLMRDRTGAREGTVSGLISEYAYARLANDKRKMRKAAHRLAKFLVVHAAEFDQETIAELIQEDIAESRRNVVLK